MDAQSLWTVVAAILGACIGGLFTIFTAIGAVIVGWLALRETQKDLTLAAYSSAVRGILEIKEIFAQDHRIFETQMKREPSIQERIPDYMRNDVPAFLAFAGGMWRFSYVYSVMSRWRELGMTENEYRGLRAEMLLWLRGVPGFYDVYLTHTSYFKAHNPDFLRFLKEEVYNQEYLRSRSGRTVPSGR